VAAPPFDGDGLAYDTAPCSRRFRRVCGQRLPVPYRSATGCEDVPSSPAPARSSTRRGARGARHRL